MRLDWVFQSKHFWSHWILAQCFFKVQAGRPIYKHESAQQYLYYHPYSGGNWLINTEIGLLYGGIQNSKDVPVCPYLINTMWQYGDSDLGGWVYDGSLKVTCPTDPCSGLISFQFKK